MNDIEIKKYDRTTKILLKEYIKAIENKRVKKPMAYALFQTWKQIDESEVERDERI